MWARTNNNIYLNTDNVLFFDVREEEVWDEGESTGFKFIAVAHYTAPEEDGYLQKSIGVFNTLPEAHVYIQTLIGEEEL